MANLFYGRDRMYSCDERCACSSSQCTEFLDGIKPFSAQLRSLRKGGLGLVEVELPESRYDEEKSSALDPLAQFGSDRFERAETVASMISEDQQRAKRDKLEHASV